MAKDVNARQLELTHQVHREILERCMVSVRTLSPILVCAMKIFIQIHSQGEPNAFFLRFQNYELNRIFRRQRRNGSCREPQLFIAANDGRSERDYTRSPIDD